MGTIWFSNVTGAPTGNTSAFNWDGNNLNVMGNINVSSLVTALNFKALSDVNLKKNISPLTNPIDNLNKISGVSYNWVDPLMSPNKQWGIIAQQLEENGLNHLVDKYLNYKTIDYNQIIPLLVESIKQLSMEIEQIKNTFH